MVIHYFHPVLEHGLPPRLNLNHNAYSIFPRIHVRRESMARAHRNISPLPELSEWTLNDIANTPRQTLFKSQNDTNTNLLLASRKSSRIPFITIWHQKLSGFQSILHLRYREMIEQFPNLKCIFPEAPILSFPCNKNLQNQLVRTSLATGTEKPSEQSGYSTPCLSKRGKGCILCPFVSNTNVITNKLSRKSCYTSGGKCSTTDTIYAAECTRHSLIYVGQSSQKLKSLFNGLRSDIKAKPKSCELSQHFHNSKECSIDRDLKVYLLQDNVCDWKLGEEGIL